MTRWYAMIDSKPVFVGWFEDFDEAHKAATSYDPDVDWLFSEAELIIFMKAAIDEMAQGD
jgi:hypothetical protein